jgi:hypothetical protein
LFNGYFYDRKEELEAAAEISKIKVDSEIKKIESTPANHTIAGGSTMHRTNTKMVQSILT